MYTIFSLLKNEMDTFEKCEEECFRRKSEINNELKTVEGKMLNIWREAAKREENEKSVAPKGLVCDEELVCEAEANKEFGKSSSKMVGLSKNIVNF